MGHEIQPMPSAKFVNAAQEHGRCDAPRVEDAAEVVGLGF